MTRSDDPHGRPGVSGTLGVIGTLLGRDAELAAVGRALERGPRGGSALAIVGEPGIGKSALLAATADLARSADAWVLTVGGVESEAHFPFASLYELLEPVLGGADFLVAAEREALLTALGFADGPAPDLFLVARATLGTLAAAATRRPVVVLVDDVQWLDQPTQECLSYVARRIAEARLSLVATARTEDPERPPAFVDAVPDALWLSGLDEEAASRLLERTASALPGSARRLITEEARGNPLALIELPATWDATVAVTAPPTLSSRLERAFGGRVEGLPGPTRDVLLVASVDERPELSEVLAAATRLAGKAVGPSDLAPARAAGLVACHEGRVEFRHPLVRSGVLRHERLSRRQAAHAAVAEVIDGEPYRQAWHRAQAIVGPDEATADELERTVPDSLRRGAVLTAIGSLERAAQLTASPVRRGHLLLRAAEHAFGLGRVDLVGRLVEQAAAGDLDELDWARMQWLREIFNDGVPGDATRVHELCDIAVRSAGAHDVDLALNLVLGAALRCWWADTGPVARAHVAQVVDALGLPDDPRSVAALAVAEPVLRAREVTEALIRRPADEVEDTDAQRLLGMAAHAIGDSPRSDDYLTACEQRLRAQHRLGVLVHALSMHVIVSLELGDWHRAASHSSEVIRLAEETGQPIWTTGSLVCEAIAQGLRGHSARALELVSEVELVAYRERLNDLLSCAQLARGLARLVSDDPATACDDLLRRFRPADPTYHQRECFGGLMFLAEAAHLAARHEEARQVVEQLEDVAVVTPTPVLHVHLAYARAVLAPPEQAEDLFRTALALDLHRWPWVRARTELAFGEWQCRHGDAARGRNLVESSLGTLDAIGAGPWAARARVLLGDTDGRGAGAAATGARHPDEPGPESTGRMP